MSPRSLIPDLLYPQGNKSNGVTRSGVVSKGVCVLYTDISFFGHMGNQNDWNGLMMS